METELDTPFIHFCLQDGLLIATYKRRLKINLSIARQVVKSRLSFTGNRLIPVLILSEGQVTMDKEARDFLASSEGTKGLSAAAMVLRNSFDWALGSFFLHLRKPAMPTRVFTRCDSAINPDFAAISSKKPLISTGCGKEALCRITQMSELGCIF